MQHMSTILSLSVPFSSGQWLLRYCNRHDGSTFGDELSVPFSSGQWLLLDKGKDLPRNLRRSLSVPFSSGQWLLRKLYQRVRKLWILQLAFSPLFIGAMVATIDRLCKLSTSGLSVPFSSGQWLLHRHQMH